MRAFSSGGWALHPFLIAIFPILSLYAHNIYETASKALVAPLGIALAGTFIVWQTLKGISRDGRRAALAASLLVTLFYAFNRATLVANGILDYLSQFWVRHVHQVHPLIMLALLALGAAPVLRLIFFRLRDPGPWTAFLNVFSVILVALPVGSATLAQLREPARPIIRSVGGFPTAARPGRRPDIYHIILDAYARSDVLKDLFDYDNEPFLRRLEQKGFFIGRRSRANYCQTTLSLCSMLNADYLDQLVLPTTRDRDPLSALLRDNRVMKTLRPHGYKLVWFATGYEPTENPEADVSLYPRHPAAGFHVMLIRMTPLRFLPLKAELWDFYTSIRERVLFTLDRLPDVADDPAPTFAFAHIVCPHHPFVFGENGEDISPRWRGASVTGGSRHDYFGGHEEYRQNYRKQVIFLTKKVEQTIDRILAASPEPPIIILQSDHGSSLRHHLNDIEATDLRERMSILNCYYIPGRKYEGLTEDITPVNSYRVVFNNVFGSDLPLRENRSYFSTYSHMFDLVDVTERLLSDRDRGRQYTFPSFYPGMVR